MLFWAQNSETDSNSEPEITSKQVMDSFIAKTGFIGTYTISNDERIFTVLKGTFPLQKVTGQETFIANCDSIIKLTVKMYAYKSDAFLMSYPKKAYIEGYFEENRIFSAWSGQTYNGFNLLVMDNQEAQNYSWYKDYTENPDSCTWYGEYFWKKHRNNELKEWRHDSDTIPIMGGILIRYKPKDEIYVIENKMLLKPVALPLLKITKDDALAIATDRFQGPANVRDLKLYAIPKDEYRTDFNLRYIWTAECPREHSGVDYSIDGTTGEILFEAHWIE